MAKITVKPTPKAVTEKVLSKYHGKPLAKKIVERPPGAVIRVTRKGEHFYEKPGLVTWKTPEGKEVYKPAEWKPAVEVIEKPKELEVSREKTIEAQRKADIAYKETQREYGRKLTERRFVEKMAREPLMKAAYVMSPEEWFGTGVLAEVGVAALTGVPWERRRKEIMEAYAAKKLAEKEKYYEFAGIPFEPKAAAIAGVKAALMAAPGGVFGKKAAIASETIMKGIYGVGVGTTIGVVIKEPTPARVARAFVYTAPLMVRGIGKVIKAKTPLGRRIEMKKVMGGMTPKEKVAFQKAMTATKAVERARVTPKSLALKAHPRLGKKAGAIVETHLKKSGEVVGGSVSQKAQMTGKIRVHDVDIFAKSPSKSGTSLFNKLKVAGIKARITISKKGTMMESAKIFIRGKKAVEFHTHTWRKAFPFKQDIVKSPKGIKMVSLTEQVSRKAYGAYVGKRVKDIPHLRRGVGELLKIRKAELKAATLFKKARLAKLEIAKAKFYGIEAKVKSPLLAGRVMKGQADIMGRISKAATGKAVPYKPYKPYEVPAYKPYLLPKIPYKPYIPPHKPPYIPKMPYKPYKVPPIYRDIFKPYKPYKPPYKPSVYYKPPYKPSVYYKPPYKPSVYYKPPYKAPPYKPPHKVPLYKPPIRAPPKRPPPTVPPAWLKKMIVKKPKMQAGYDVFSKVLGRRKKIASNVTKRTAFSRGSHYVDTTPAATFTIKKSGKTTKKPDIFGWLNIKHKFRVGKKHPWEVIEKKRYRIDSIGEVLGLKKAKKVKIKTKKGIDLRKVL